MVFHESMLIPSAPKLPVAPPTTTTDTGHEEANIPLQSGHSRPLKLPPQLTFEPSGFGLGLKLPVVRAPLNSDDGMEEEEEVTVASLNLLVEAQKELLEMPSFPKNLTLLPEAQGAIDRLNRSASTTDLTSTSEQQWQIPTSWNESPSGDFLSNPTPELKRTPPETPEPGDTTSQATPSLKQTTPTDSESETEHQSLFAKPGPADTQEWIEAKRKRKEAKKERKLKQASSPTTDNLTTPYTADDFLKKTPNSTSTTKNPKRKGSFDKHNVGKRHVADADSERIESGSDNGF